MTLEMSDPKSLRRLGVNIPIDGITLYLYTDGSKTFLLVPENIAADPRVLAYPENKPPDVIIDAAKYFPPEEPPPGTAWHERLRQEYQKCKDCNSENLNFQHNGFNSEVFCTEPDCGWYCYVRNEDYKNA